MVSVTVSAVSRWNPMTSRVVMPMSAARTIEIQELEAGRLQSIGHGDQQAGEDGVPECRVLTHGRSQLGGIDGDRPCRRDRAGVEGPPVRRDEPRQTERVPRSERL